MRIQVIDQINQKLILKHSAKIETSEKEISIYQIDMNWVNIDYLNDNNCYLERFFMLFVGGFLTFSGLTIVFNND